MKKLLRIRKNYALLYRFLKYKTILVSMVVPSGIDTHLDELRKSSASLVDALRAGSEALSGDCAASIIFSAEGLSSAESRVSESRSAYQTWDVMPVQQLPRAEGWNETLNLSKEYMDPKAWRSEARDAQEKTEKAIDTMLVTAAAGSLRSPDAKAPSFFAWPDESPSGNSPAITEKTEAKSWVRVGEGWKSHDGVFYSDADLVKDVLSASAGAKDLLEVPTENLSSSPATGAGDNIGDIYHTETEDRYKWIPPTPEQRIHGQIATVRQNGSPEKSGSCANDRLGLGKRDGSPDNGLKDWISEYDAQSLRALQADPNANGPPAGQASGMNSGPKVPLCFSWARSVPVAAATTISKSTILVTPPYGADTENQEAWHSEYETSFRLPGPAAAQNADMSLPPVPPSSHSSEVVQTAQSTNISSAQVVPPYGVDKHTAWESEYSGKFNLNRNISSDNAVLKMPSAVSQVSSTEQELASLVRGFEALRSAVNAASSSASTADAAIPAEQKSKKMPTLRFNTETGRAFKWPVAAQSAALALPKDEGIFHISDHARPSTVATNTVRAVDALMSEAKARFNGATPSDPTIRAPIGRGNPSNLSDPSLLIHTFINVKPKRGAVTCATTPAESPAEIAAAQMATVEEEADAEGTLTAETEMYSGEDFDAEVSAAAACTESESHGAGDDDDSTANAVAGTAASSITGIRTISGQPTLINMGNGQIIDVEEALHQFNRAAAAATASKAQVQEAKKAQRPKAHLKGKALMLEKQRKASRAAALSHIVNAKKGQKSGSPVLRNTRYPSTSDAQNGRWRSESSAQFVWRAQPLQL